MGFDKATVQFYCLQRERLRMHNLLKMLSIEALEIILQELINRKLIFEALLL
jgi:hypothetical protein